MIFTESTDRKSLTALLLFLTVTCHEKNKAHPRQGFMVVFGIKVFSFHPFSFLPVIYICLSSGHKTRVFFLNLKSNVLMIFGSWYWGCWSQSKRFPFVLKHVWTHLREQDFIYSLVFVYCCCVSLFFLCSSAALYFTKRLFIGGDRHRAPCKWSTESCQSTQTVFLQWE